jgi:hypothetical protein
MTQALTDAQLHGDHGGQGSQEARFTRLLQKNVDYQPLALSEPDKVIKQIAAVMDQGVDPLDDLPDDQENPFVPAGYTYLGQLVDHDLTFDTRSVLDTLPAGLSSFPDDERTPRFDLDCLYGEGPGSGAFMYDADGRLATNPDTPFDLPRARTLFNPGDPTSHRAIIGDPRNDENSIVCQLQLSFIKFHNKLIDAFKAEGLTNKGNALFHSAQKEVRFSYQLILVTDFLKRIVQKSVYDGFVSAFNQNENAAFKLYKPGPARAALPLEFTGAAYRFGHSGVRNAYRLNDGFQKRIFDGSDDSADSLVGFGDLPASHQIDWTLFYTNALAPGDKADNPSTNPDGSDVAPKKKRLQFAYKLDTSLVDPLAHLPGRISGADANTMFASLAARNLKRGYNFNLPSGQDVARVLGVARQPPLLFGDTLTPFNDMDISRADAAALQNATPLWLYILAEGQACLADGAGVFKRGADGKIDKDSNTGTQLGPVGGRILLEVFFGLLDSDPGSYFWEPSWTPKIKPGAKALTMWDLMSYIGAV